MMRVAAAGSGFHARIGLAVTLTAAADFLLFDKPVGLSLLLFAALLCAGIIAASPRDIGTALVSKCLLLLAGLFPLVESVSALSISVAVFSFALFALAMARRLRAGLAVAVKQAVPFLLAAPFRLPIDVVRWRRAARRIGSATIRFAGIAVWMMPIVLAIVFVALFGAANPVVEHWLSLIDLRALLDLLSFRRLAFWLVVVLCVWAFLRPRLPTLGRHRPKLLTETLPKTPTAAPTRLRETLFGKAAILRALLVFNLIFAVQTVLDGTYLWGGVALPEGLTYADYAHRGAYPLIATALLAAGFVLAAMRPGTATAADRTIRLLVYLWVVQNVILVLASILRLDLYVDIYSLTYWRVAAFVWMMLVAAGLMLIMARIALEKPNSWLMNANLLTLSFTLYACCFVNFAGLIADYNVRHSFGLSGRGQLLDTMYLRGLGAAAIPAIDLYLDKSDIFLGDGAPGLNRERRSLAFEHLRRQSNWRAWTFRDWRLSRYLEENPAPPVQPARLFEH